MIRLASPPLLARLRRSPRFIVLMLLVFVLRIGADVAGTTHDTLDASVESAAVEMTLDTFGFDRGDSEQSPFDVSGACDHCGCHQASAILPAMIAASGTIGGALLAQQQILALPDMKARERRPPIA